VLNLDNTLKLLTSKHLSQQLRFWRLLVSQIDALSGHGTLLLRTRALRL